MVQNKNVEIEKIMKDEKKDRVHDDIMRCPDLPEDTSWVKYSGQVVYVRYADADTDDEIKQQKGKWFTCVFIADCSGEVYAQDSLEQDQLQNLSGYFLFVYDEQPTWSKANVYKYLFMYS